MKAPPASYRSGSKAHGSSGNSSKLCMQAELQECMNQICGESTNHHPLEGDKEGRNKERKKERKKRTSERTNERKTERTNERTHERTK